MQPDDANEFVGKRGHHHILSPIGYGRILKSVVRGCPVRSAVEQYNIHNIAYDFESKILYIPKTFELHTNYSYSMEHILIGQRLHPLLYKAFPTLVLELTRFYKFMQDRGYFPFAYSILNFDNVHFCLLDFSMFGTIFGSKVRFKHEPNTLELAKAESIYGLSPLLDQSWIILEPFFEKIEDPSDEELKQ